MSCPCGHRNRCYGMGAEPMRPITPATDARDTVARIAASDRIPVASIWLTSAGVLGWGALIAWAVGL